MVSSMLQWTNKLDFYFLFLVGWLVTGMCQYKIEIQWQVKKTNF